MKKWLLVLVLAISACDQLVPDREARAKVEMDKIVDRLSDQVSAAELAPRVAIHSHLPSLNGLLRELKALEVPDGMCGLTKLQYVGYFEIQIMRIERFATSRPRGGLDNVNGIDDLRSRSKC